MIVDCLPDEFQKFAQALQFRAWQTGLFLQVAQHSTSLWAVYGNFVPINNPPVKIVSMGSHAGHTYFAKALALRDCPVRTKVYVGTHQALAEYSSLTIRSYMCHEAVEMLPRRLLSGYNGAPVSVVVVDLDDTAISSHREALADLYKSVSPQSIILLLDCRAEIV